MKYSIKLWGSILLVLLVITSCNKKSLTDLNINPNTLNEIDPEYMLAQAQLMNETHQYSYEPIQYYLPGYVQHFAAIAGVMNFGDKYLNNRPEDMDAFYSTTYTNPIVNLVDIIRITKDDPDRVALHSIARIMRVFIMHRLTDFYGDIVYFEGGQGFSPGILRPIFDKQSDIYADMLKELDESATALAATSNTLKNPVQDIFYYGDNSKWKKFAYSLMLRLAMRMSNVDEASAKQWVSKAIAGGLMTSNADNTVLVHEDGTNIAGRNPISLVFESSEVTGEKLSKTLIDWLKNNDDPRLMIYTMGIGPAGGPYDTDPTHQKGMPNGYDEVTLRQYEGLPASADLDIDQLYSTVNTAFISRTAPSVYLSYAEVEFMLAEAAQRGLISEDAATHYNNGVTAAMKMYSIFGSSLTVTDSDIATYLSTHPYNASTGLQMIGEQYWAVNFTNPEEAWANWRRTGYPVLVPVQFSGAVYNDQIPRRFLYPTSEAATNTDNYNAVIARQGADTWNTHVWWDK